MTDPTRSRQPISPALLPLWQRHRDTNYERIAVVESVAAAVLLGPLDEELRQAGEQAAHKLAGSLGTFGIPEGSASAFTIEAMLREGPLVPHELADAVVALREVVEAVEAVEASRPVGEAGGTEEVPGAAQAGQLPPPVPEVSPVHRLVVCSESAGMRTRLTTAATSAGWSATVVEAVDQLPGSLANAPAATAVVVDVPRGSRIPPPQPPPGSPQVPVIALAASEDPADRLALARAGATGFLPRTTPGPDVISFVESVVARAVSRPLTVVSVQRDAPDHADLLEALPEPGFHVTSFTSAEQGLEAILSAKPDVVLLGLGPESREDLPLGDALSLCRAVRSDPGLRSVAVVVCAPVHDPTVVEAALACGADDVVGQPVSAVELRARILARAARGKAWSETPPGSEVLSVDILVVEDDPSVADVIEYAMELHGLTIRRVTNGAEAAELLCIGGLIARLVLLDVGLPGLDGFAVLSRLRDSGVLGRIPVVMLTARASESETLEALELGATDHIAKPFSVPILVSKVERILRRSR